MKTKHSLHRIANRQRSYSLVVCIIGILLFINSCFRYSLTGVNIPENVQTVFIPFFPNQAPTAVPGLADQINAALINRFVNQSRLRLASNRSNADALVEGVIISYSNKAFSISNNETASLNRVEISVRASFKYASEDKEKWNKTFNGFGEYDPSQDPINGENEAAQEAIEQLVENMFNEALGGW